MLSSHLQMGQAGSPLFTLTKERSVVVFTRTPCYHEEEKKQLIQQYHTNGGVL